MRNPVPFVVIHHSASPPACYTRNECVAAMRSMQIYHQQTQGWYDIGYSFAVGGDGAAYEGRGWSTVGAHAPSFNDKSIGICVIGDWRGENRFKKKNYKNNNFFLLQQKNHHHKNNWMS